MRNTQKHEIVVDKMDTGFLPSRIVKSIRRDFKPQCEGPVRGTQAGLHGAQALHSVLHVSTEPEFCQAWCQQC